MKPVKSKPNNEVTMKLSQRALDIESSPTLSLNDLANKLKADGKPVLNLGVGEPTNLAPLSATEKAISRLNTRSIKYSSVSGTAELKKAIIQYTTKNYDVTPSFNNLLVTVGAKQAIFNTLFALLNSSDEVILLAPYWVSYPEMVKMAGGNPVVVMPITGTLSTSLVDIQKSVTSRTKAIIINNPNNPSGLVYSSALVRDLVVFCEKNNIFLIMDDIYHKLVYGDQAWTPGYAYTHKALEKSHIIVINGISKSYGMTGFRIGWAIGSSDLIKVMTNIQSQTTSGASIVLQDGALGALTGEQFVVNELCGTIKDNRDITVRELKRIPDINLVEPEGAFYCLPDFSQYMENSMELSKFILEKALVAVVPGAAFGIEGHLRISYAGNTDDISEAIRRINWALNRNSQEEIRMGDQIYKRNW
jgi:aspartate aminotransferase